MGGSLNLGASRMWVEAFSLLSCIDVRVCAMWGVSFADDTNDHWHDLTGSPTSPLISFVQSIDITPAVNNSADLLADTTALVFTPDYFSVYSPIKTTDKQSKSTLQTEKTSNACHSINMNSIEFTPPNALLCLSDQKHFTYIDSFLGLIMTPVLTGDLITDMIVNYQSTDGANSDDRFFSRNTANPSPAFQQQCRQPDPLIC